MRLGIEIGINRKYFTPVNGWVRASVYFIVKVPWYWGGPKPRYPHKMCGWGGRTKVWRFYYGNV